jgi:hypothetical protein
MESLQSLQFPDSVLGANLAAFQPIQDFGARGRWVRFDKFQAARDASETGFDGGVAYTKNLLHFFDGAMTADESGDENLIFRTQTGQLGQLKSAFDNDVFVGDADAFDQDWLALR